MEIPENKYLLRFDGASKGNPGKAGAGAVLYLNDNEIWSMSIYIDQKQTNNYAEYVGVLIGLKEAVKRDIKDIASLLESSNSIIMNQIKKELKSYQREARKKRNGQGNFFSRSHCHIFKSISLNLKDWKGLMA